MSTLWQDLRYALRMLRRRPGFTLLAVLAMGLGIGANTAIFSVVHSVLLRRLPYRDPDRLTVVWLDNRRLNLHEDLTSWANFEDWRQNQVFEGMVGFRPSSTTLTGRDEPERLTAALVGAGLFKLMGAAPALGRAFTVEEETPGKDRVVLLSHGLWQRRFGGRRQIVGQSITLDGEPWQVIGVMPPEFRFPRKETELWQPLAVPPRAKQQRGGFWLSVIGRLKPGVPLERARAEMDAIGKRLEQQYPRSNTGYGVFLRPLEDQIVGPVRQALLVLFAAVMFVLLMACANVANLLLGRAAEREREMAVRAALGAGRWRLARQMLTESVVLALLAGTAGLLLAFWGVAALRALGPPDLPRLDEIHIDLRVLLFTLGISLFTGLLFGLAPALRASGPPKARATSRTPRGLVAGQIAMALVLAAGAGLMIRSFARLRAEDPGFRAERLITMRLVVSRSKTLEAPQVVAFYDQLLERLRALPGVQAVGAIRDIFLISTPNSAGFTVEGAPPVPLEQQIEATIDPITPGYFQAMGTPLLRGRFFHAQDGRDSLRVVIVNNTMARRFWPNQDPIGKRFKLGGPQSTDPWLTIVGVVGDMRRQGLEKQARSETFLPLAQSPSRGMNLVLRTAGDPLALAAAVRREIRALDPDLPILGVTTIEDRLDQSVAQRRFQMVLLALFAALALALAAIGIYGVMYHAVARRTQEIGVRMALGAQPGDVLRMVLGEGLRLAAIGVAAGLATALLLTRLMSTLLYGVRPHDPATFVGVALLLTAIALAASYVPARRATRVDPMTALRYE